MAMAEMVNKSERLQATRLRDNLIHLMKLKDTNMTSIHRQTGVPVTTIQRICKDSGANPTLASLMPLADFFSVTVAQLIGEEPLPSAKEKHLTPRRWTNVPVINWQQAVYWLDVPSIAQQPRYVTTEIGIGENSFALEINDDHHNNFQKGALLIVDPSLSVNHRDYVISYKEGSQQASLKQVLMHEGDIYLKPTNSDFKTTLMDNQHRIIGVVVQVKMNLK